MYWALLFQLGKALSPALGKAGSLEQRGKYSFTCGSGWKLGSWVG